jgi:hypothetical protein
MDISICGLRRLESCLAESYTKCGCIGVANDATQVQPKKKFTLIVFCDRLSGFSFIGVIKCNLGKQIALSR